MKTCTQCNIEKDIEEFHRNKRTRDGRVSSCADCFNNRPNRVANKKRRYASSKRWVKKHKVQAAAIRLKANLRQYGLTLEDYNQMLGEQNSLCANPACRMINDGTRLAVDHDHKTGKVRGLLCDACNLGLGQFRDNVELMAGGIQYLNNSTGLTGICGNG